MPRLLPIRVFLEVARVGSFTSAARNLGLSKSAVSKHIAAIERDFGVSLVKRTTHNVSVTDAGRLLVERGTQLIEDYRRLERDVRSAVASLRGTIRVGVPPAFGTLYLIPAVHAFTRARPGCNVVLLLDDGGLDIVRDNLDMTLRISASLKDASYVSRRLADVPQYLVASPAYLEARGVPERLEDLRNHECLVHLLKSPSDVWRFGYGAEAAEVPVRGAIRSNFGSALRQAALEGAGIAMHPRYMVREDLEEGRLVHVLPKAPPPLSLSVHAIHASRDLPLIGKRWLRPMGRFSLTV